MLQMSELGRQMLITLEGFKTKPYRDSKGLWTIGVGHLLTAAELQSGIINLGQQAIVWQRGLSEAQVDALLAQDLPHYEQAVRDAVTLNLTQYQFDALVSFCFNVGITAWLNSGLLKMINYATLEQVPNEWKRWRFVTDNKGQKTELRGLIERRNTEITCWLGELAGYEPVVSASVAASAPASAPTPAPTMPTPSATPPSPSRIQVSGQTQQTPARLPEPSIALPAPPMNFPTPTAISRAYRPDNWLALINPLDWLPEWGTYLSLAAIIALYLIDDFGWHVPKMAYDILLVFAAARMRRAYSRPTRYTPSYGDEP